MKKFLCAILCLTLLLGVSACGNESEDPEATETPEIELPDVVVSESDIVYASPTPTPEPEAIENLAVCGINLIRDGQLTGLGFGGAEYADGVLKLTDAVLSSSDENEPVISYSGGELEIVLEGVNTIEATNGAAVISCAGDEGNVTISGSGSLTATAADAVAISLPGTLTISATVDVTGAPAADCQEVLAGEGAELSENSESHIVAYAETAAL